MRRFLLIAMLFASTPAIAEPSRSIEDGHERFDADKKALQEKIYGESSGMGFTFCSAFMRGLTLGLSDIVMRRFGDQDFPVVDDARRINPGVSAAGTVLGGLVFAGIVYSSLVLALARRRAVRATRRLLPSFIPPIEPSDEPDGLDDVVGSFVTRDGYEFVVMRHSRNVNVDDSLN